MKLQDVNRVAYVAGPMRGREKFNFPAFDAAAMKYREKGWTVYSPAEFDREAVGGVWADLSDECIARIEANLTINNCMSADMECLCNFQVNTIILLKGWERSQGVRPEVALGICLGMDFFLDETGEQVYPEVRITLKEPANGETYSRNL